MLRVKVSSIATVALLVVTGCFMFAQGQNRSEGSSSFITTKVEKELATLPYYGIFDNLAYSVNGGTVTLMGQVVRPTTKSDAENRVKKIQGVTQVINNIEVLPLSPFDNQTRRAEYRTIFSEPGLQRYAQGANPSIHIIVDNGHVTLEGVVDSVADKNLAGIRANSVSGVFSVINNLRVARRS